MFPLFSIFVAVKESTDPMKYDVFISYSSHDQKVVEGLCAYLEQHKIRCFVTYRDIPRGVVWARAIVEALDESRMMVVVFSEHFNNSDQVDREIELASEDKKPILTFRITNDAFKGAKKYYLKNINWIDAFPNPEQVFGSVADNIARLLGLNLEVAKPAPAKTYKVGDYYDDGKKKGVVFEVSVDGKHGKIVSLTGSIEYLQWSSDKNEQKRFIGADDEYNGANNMAKVKQIAGWREKYPAFAWCADLGEDWYLPAKQELNSIYNVKDKLNATLASNGVALDVFWHWSSTEENREWYGAFCAWRVLMYGGYTVDSNKGNLYYVRAVSAF